MSWSKTITDLHEQLSPNEELATMMDLHNNRIGRQLFAEFSGLEDEGISRLQQMTKEAIQVKSISEIGEIKNKLVFIEKIKVQS